MCLIRQYVHCIKHNRKLTGPRRILDPNLYTFVCFIQSCIYARNVYRILSKIFYLQSEYFICSVELGLCENYSQMKLY